MWRAAVLACGLWTALAPPAGACLVDTALEGIAYYDAVPPNLADDQLALDVEFDEDEVDRLNGVVTAQVRRVLHGAYTSDTVRVVLDNSSCTRSFLFGHEGIIVGRFVSPREAPHRTEAPPIVVAETRRVRGPIPLPENLVLSWPVNETVFVPEIETLDDYDARIAGLHPLTDNANAFGDYNGDDKGDAVRFYESEDGALTIGVYFIISGEITPIWGGDISSFERFSVSTAPAGTYSTACDLYGGCPVDVPEQVTLTHDGVFVHEVDRANDLLYYWDGAAFQNIIVAE